MDIIKTNQNTITYFKKENGLPSDSTRQIREDKEKRIWLNYSHFGLYVIHRQAGSVTSLDNATMNLKPAGKGGGLIYNIADDGKGNMLVDYITDYSKQSNDVKIININNKTSQQIRNLQFGLVYSMFGDRYGQTWLCYLYGLFVLNKNGRHIHHAGNTDTTTALAEDARNNLWIGTTNGIKILNKAKIFNEIPGIRADSLRGFNVIDGKMYVRPFRGTDIIDSAYTTITHFGNNIIASATVLQNDNIWQKNWETHGIEVFNLKKKLHFHVDVSEEKQSEPGNKQSQRPQTIIQDTEGNISLCSGLCFLGVIDSGSAYIRYTDSALSPEVATEKPMCFDMSGNVWIGIDTVLYMINKRRDSVTMFTPKNGLLNSAIKFLNEFNNRIYAGTGAGLSIVTPPNALTGNTWHIQPLGKDDGFSNSFHVPGAILHDGTYLWDGDGGITFLPPPQLTKSVKPKTYITGIDVYNEPQSFPAKPGG